MMRTSKQLPPAQRDPDTVEGGEGDCRIHRGAGTRKTFVR